MYKSRTASSNNRAGTVAGSATGFGKDGMGNDRDSQINDSVAEAWPAGCGGNTKNASKLVGQRWLAW